MREKSGNGDKVRIMFFAPPSMPLIKCPGASTNIPVMWLILTTNPSNLSAWLERKALERLLTDISKTGYIDCFRNIREILHKH